MISKIEKLMFFKSLKENKLSHDQEFSLITLSFASENVSNLLILRANTRIHYYSFKM